MPPQTPQALALAAKEKGNASFKSSQWLDAIGHYTQACVLDRSEPTYPLNRAMAYLKLSKFQDAERDCSIAIALQRSSKAFFRRGSARAGMGSWEGAEADFAEALKLDPKNDVARKELERARASRVREGEKKPRTKPMDISPSASPSPPPASQPAAPSTSTSAPLRRRVPIKIVDSSSPPLALAPSTSVPSKAVSSPPAAADALLNPFSTRRTTTTPQPSSFAEARALREARERDAARGVGTAERQMEALSQSGSPAPSPAAQAMPMQLSPSPSAHPLPAFQRAWRDAPTPYARFSLLARQARALPPPKPFLPDTPAPDFVGECIDALSSAWETDKEVARRVVRELPRTRRWALNVGFLSKGEREAIGRVTAGLGEGGAEWGL